jgi:hypothetical protein
VIEKIKQLFLWLRKNERHISTVVFVGGTTTDILTLSKFTILHAITLLGVYTAVAIAASIAEHYLYSFETTKNLFLRGLRVTLTFVAEFMIGCLLSGILVFYTRSATLTASWPFVLLLIIVLFGNEFLRNYKEQLAFRCTLLFFTIYAYFVFALPTVLHHISPSTFLESSAAAIVVFALFLAALVGVGRKRLRASLWEIVAGVAGVLVFVNVSYFTGIIPPLPLSLKDVGVYHSIVRTAGGYEVQAETNTLPWWDIDDIKPLSVNLVPGDSLSVFSSVFAPTAFSSAIVHRWEWYDPATKKWETKAEIAFGISGGRDDGYRGYSTLTNIVPGYYRVSIQTVSGQVIGRVYFNVNAVQAEPTLHTEIH